MIRSLEEQNIERLYPQQYDKKIELKKLNRSVVICFLELLDILIDNPSSEERNEKVKDLSILFINMHHLINEYRPHQAREALRVVLERQKRQRDDMKHQIKRAIDKAEGLLKTCDSNLQQAVSSLPNIEEPAEPMEVTENNKSTELTENCHSYIDAQDFELINLINGFISQEMIS
jgi:mediator of RNA polymerase II transcription subunit 7